ncbi:MAG: competence protein ComEC [Verrucomicrobiales bacterium]
MRANSREGWSKRLRADPLFFVALAAALGIVLADQFATAVPFGAAFVVLGIVSWRWRHLARGPLLVWPAIALGFATIHAFHLQAFRAFPHFERIAADAEGLHVSAVGRVLQEPRTVGFAKQAALQLQEITIDGRSYHLTHQVLIRVSDHAISYGDVLAFTGRLFLPEPPRNPGQFDYRTYLQRHDWVGIVDVGRSEQLEVREQKPHAFKSMALRARERMALAITRDLEREPEICGVLTAMVLGMRDQATPEMERPFRYSGTLHIFAVSGLHVGIFALIAWLCLKPLGLSRSHVTFILIPLLFFYAFVTGWRPSAVRAATMAAVFLASYCMHRDPRLPNSLGLAAILILAGNTNQLFLPGFELSFAVLLTIIVFAKPIQRPFRHWLYPDAFIPVSLLEEHEQRAYVFRRWLGDIVAVSVAAWFGSLFLMAFTFHLVTPVAVLANCLLMPLGFFILFTAAMSMLSSTIAILGPVNILFNNANFALVHGLIGLAEGFSSVPGGHFLVSGRLPFTRPPIEITVLDMPRGGGCAHVQVRGGPNELIDVGHVNSFRRLTEPYLRHAGLNGVDRLWLTHGDTGHSGAAAEILDLYHTKVYQPSWPSRSPSTQRIGVTLEQRKMPPTLIHAGHSLPLAQAAYWEILYPPQDESFAPAPADDRGLVMRLHAYDWRVLLMADAGFHTERWLLDSEQDLRADVLIKGNHADDVSGLAEFLAAVNPQVIVMDSETDNPSSVSGWKAKHAVHVVDQKEVGAVILGISKSKIKVRGFRADQEIFLKRER